MSGPETRREGVLRKHFQMLTILGLAIMSGVVIFGVAAGYVYYSGMLEPTLAEIPFAREALVAVGILMMLSVPRVGNALGPSPSDHSVEVVLKKHKMSVIVTLALREGAAFVGMVIGMLGGEMELGLGVAALAVLTMAIGWPKRGELEDHLRRAGG